MVVIQYTLLFSFLFSPSRLSDLKPKVKVDSLDVRIAAHGRVSIHASEHRTEYSLIKGVLAQLTPNSRLLVPTKWHVRVESVDTIDPHGAGVKPVCRLDSSIDILSEHGRSETVHGVVGLADDIYDASLYKKKDSSFLNEIVLTVHILKLDDNTDRTKDLLADDLHLRLGIRENRGFDKVSFIACRLAS